MKNTFGQAVTLTLFGESHGAAVGAVLDGLAPGLPVDGDLLRRQLSRRRPTTALDTARQEPDNYQILSGVFQGRTTGTPLTIVIPNENTRSGDYSYGLARPSHADYAAYCKYHGYEDWRGGGHFSGRVTAALVAAACFAVDRVLFHGVLSPEKWDDMSYEECLHRATGRTVLLYVIVVAAPIAALLYSFLSLLRT